MRIIQFDLPELRQIEINGNVFALQKADMDIMEKGVELQNKYSKLASDGKSAKLEEIIDAVKDIIGYIDEILGDGATQKITDGRPLGVVNAVKLMITVCEVVMEEYNEKISDKYE